MNIKSIKKFRLVRIGIAMILAMMLFTSTVSTSNAYILEPGWKLLVHDNIGVYISSDLSDVTIKSNVNKWNTYTGRVSFLYSAISAQIKFMDNRSLDNGTYATTFLRSGANKDIIIYKSFKSLSTVRKNETIVHETGHALGLGHSDKTTTAVMRATGFNDKAYPLSDDIAGIKALY